MWLRLVIVSNERRTIIMVPQNPWVLGQMASSKFCILVFLYHSFHYPCYLFENFDCQFLVIIDWLFTTCVFATLAIIGTTLVCGRFRSRVFISKILVVLFVPGYLAIWHAVTGLLLDILQRATSWLKISMVEKLISKKLVNPCGLYDNSLLMGHHPTWLYCSG